MFEFFGNLMNSQTFFERAARGVLAFVAAFGVAQGWFDATVGAMLTGGALFIGAGEKNPK